MPKYKCLNKDCPSFNIIITCNSVTIMKDGHLIDSATKCPICSSKRILIVENGMTIAMQGSVNICKH